MKKIIPLFLLALLPLAARAADDWYYSCDFYFYDVARCRYEYARETVDNGDGVTQTVTTGTPLGTKEILRVAIVQDGRSAEEQAAGDPISIDIAGNLVCASEAVTAAWMNLEWSEGAAQVGKGTYVEMKDGLPAVYPINDVYTLSGSFSTSLSTTSPVYAYVVTLDTRSPQLDDACPGGAGEYIASRYALARAPAAITNPPGGGTSVGGGAYTFYCFDPLVLDTCFFPAGMELTDDGTVVDTWKSAEITDATVLTVDGKEYDRAALEVLLTPTLASATFVEPATGASLAATTEAVKTLQIQASSTDLVYYTLYTATSLTGEWTTFDALLEEKDVDKAAEKEYTRFRIDGESKTITIPVYDDATRFYQFRMN